MKKTYTRIHLSLKLKLRMPAPDADALRDAVRKLAATLLIAAVCAGIPAALWLLAMSP